MTICIHYIIIGKTFLFNLLIAILKLRNDTPIVSATSGVAAKLLIDGCTVHSNYGVPLVVLPESLCDLNPNTCRGKLVLDAKILIFDEVGMLDKAILEMIDKSLQTLCDCTLPFGGKTVVFSGDFRQILPVVKRGNRASIMGKIAKFVSFWSLVHTYKMKENNGVKRFIREDPTNENAYKDHADFLLRVGEGKESVVDDDNLMEGSIKIPEQYVLETNGDNEDDDMKNLLKFVYPEIFQDISEVEIDHERAILCPLNKDANQVNEEALKILAENNTSLGINSYLSADTVDANSKDTLASFLSTEFINTLNPPGLPSHFIKLFNG